MARPPLPEAERKSEVVKVRLTPSELTRLAAAAERRGVSVSEMARRLLARAQ